MEAITGKPLSMILVPEGQYEFSPARARAGEEASIMASPNGTAEIFHHKAKLRKGKSGDRHGYPHFRCGGGHPSLSPLFANAHHSDAHLKTSAFLRFF